MERTGRAVLIATVASWLLVMVLPATGMPAGSGLDLLPVPSSLTVGNGKLPVDEHFLIVIEGQTTPSLEAAAARFLHRLQRRTGIPMVSEPVGNSESGVLEIRCAGKGAPVPSFRTDESYTLEVTGERARLSAPAPEGIFRGLETLLQLVDIDADSFFIPAVKIVDGPRFRWRGLLIDVSRHFQTVEMIKRNLDAMAAVKMNVLHWHLSDDQGFRVESKVFPKLHRFGSDGKYYTQDQVREIVAYAADRGIRIVPEFDMPGHSTSWLVGYPELAAASGPYEIERGWGVFEPSMDPSKEELYEFLDAFVEEMSGLFPDEYFHIGGDEVHPTHWNASGRIREFKERHNLEDNHALQAYFNRRMLEILEKHGKKMIGWDEILHPELPKNIIVQSWRQDSLVKAVRQGYFSILSRGYYLDHMHPASYHYAIDPLGNAAAGRSESEKARILGGEACMWAEFVNPENIESRIWPRAAAIAERLWSPSSVDDVADLYRRLESFDRELIRLGLQHHTLYLEGMQRLVGNTDARTLLVFADLVKPPILSIRKEERTYYSDTPLNRLVDAIRPESGAARSFADLVDRRISALSGETGSSKEIRESLDRWLANDEPLQAVIEQSYLLKETRPLAETVAELCRSGLEALLYLDNGQKPPEAWREKTAALLLRAEQPMAEMYIAILPPLKNLIEAAWQ